MLASAVNVGFSVAEPVSLQFEKRGHLIPYPFKFLPLSVPLADVAGKYTEKHIDKKKGRCYVGNRVNDSAVRQHSDENKDNINSKIEIVKLVYAVPPVHKSGNTAS